MEIERHPELKGFDAYELKLGDELRGERASLGKTLLDVQRDLRIRADYIDAIERCDASAFPFAGFAAGYVRSYARYLGLDGDDVFRRFCQESGFGGVDQVGVERKPNQASSQRTAAGADAVSKLDISTQFLEPNKRAMRLDLGASMRGAASVAALAALVIGLGYGGWSMLQNLQRVGFAPLPEAPEVHVSAPDFFSPAGDGGVRDAAPVELASARESLADIYAAQEIEIAAVEPRDGPISSIDPERAGIYAPPAPAEAPVVVADDFEIEGEVAAAFASVDPGLRAAAGVEATTYAMSAELADIDRGAEEEPLAPILTTGVAVHAVEEAWVRVRDGGGKVLFTGILGAGEQFIVPPEATAPMLRAGNAGGVYIVVGGEAFGPLGRGPEVAKNVSLTGDDVRAAYPQADAAAVSRAETQREAALPTGVASLD